MVKKNLWIESDDAKWITLKKKLKKESELETIKNAVKPVEAEKLKKENKKKEFEDSIERLRKEAIEHGAAQKKQEEFVKELKSSYKSRNTAYITAYPLNRAEKWIEKLKEISSSDKDYTTNVVKIKMAGKEFDAVLDEVDCISGAIAWQLARIEVSNFNSAVESISESIISSSRKGEIKNTFKKIRDGHFVYMPRELDENRNNEFVYMFANENFSRLKDGEFEFVNVGGERKKQWRASTDNPTIKNFPHEEFFELCSKILTDNNGSVDWTLVDELSKKSSKIANNIQISIMSTQKDETEDEYVLENTGLAALKGKFFIAGSFDSEEIITKKIDNGLHGWFDLYNEVFHGNSFVREKCIAWSDSITLESTDIPENPFQQDVFLLTDKNFLDNYSYKSNVTGELVYCTYDYDKTLISNENIIEELKNLIDLKKGEISKQNLEIIKINDEIRQEQDKILVEEKKIEDLIETRVEAIKTEIKKNDFSKSDFDWGSFKNILKAADVKQKLYDIKFLKNEGDANGTIKDAELEKVWILICQNQSPHWNSTIKGIFLLKGNNTKERISKVKSEIGSGGPSLELFREVFNALGENDVVAEIDKELDFTPPQNGGKLKEDELKAALYIDAADQTLIDKWNNLSGASPTFKTQTKIKELIDKVAANAATKTAFITWVKGKESSITATDDAAWKEIMKKEPKQVIEWVLGYRLEKESGLKDTTKTNMENWEATVDNKKKKLADSYFDDKGKPSEAGMLNFLYEETIGANHSTKDVVEAPQNGGGNNGDKPFWKKYGYIGIWAPLLVITVGAVAIFWKQISEWWSGPTEEGGEVGGEKEEENE